MDAPLVSSLGPYKAPLWDLSQGVIVHYAYDDLTSYLGPLAGALMALSGIGLSSG